MTKEQAMRCAKREPGRSWEAISSEIRKIGDIVFAADILVAYCNSLQIREELGYQFRQHVVQLNGHFT